MSLRPPTSHDNRDTPKGTVRFQPGAALGPDLVAKFVRARMDETDAAAELSRATNSNHRSTPC
jgi:uncharacterized protein YdhG (YjbR/CyaY superfamily)